MFLVIYIPVVSVVPIACVQTPPPPTLPLSLGPSVDKTFLELQNSLCPTQPHSIIPDYNVNTNEIPGELSRENLVSSHVKITGYLHM